MKNERQNFFIFLNKLFFNLECFQLGQCKDSLFLSGQPMADEFACLELCKSG